MRIRLAFALLILTFLAKSQDSLVLHNTVQRKIFLGGATFIGAAGSLAYLHDAWYSRYNTGKFHFFNDNAEWLQMDKVGHAFTSYQTGRLMMDAFRWAGFSRRQQLLAGGTVGFVYLAAIEVLDGFSKGWGFSWGDMAANSLGCGLAIVQEVSWKRQIVQMKFSYLPTRYAAYNPKLLGETALTRILKDYNGQVYWISFNPFVTRKNTRSRFPAWLNVAIGYGATGMTGGHANNVPVTGEQGQSLYFERERVFFLSLDADLTRIRCRSRTLRGVLSALNVLKIPFPALAVRSNGLGGYLIR